MKMIMAMMISRLFMISLWSFCLPEPDGVLPSPRLFAEIEVRVNPGRLRSLIPAGDIRQQSAPERSPILLYMPPKIKYPAERR
jgi:hypothetical protein